MSVANANNTVPKVDTVDNLSHFPVVELAIGQSLISASNPLNIQGAGAAGAALAGNPLPVAWQDQSGNAVVPFVNQDLTLLASAARTAATPSADQTNQNARGVMIFLNVTVASGTGGLTVRIQGKDPVSGSYFNLNAAPSAVTSVTTASYVWYPGASVAGNVAQASANVLPRTWRINVTVGDSSSYTYSVGASLII